MEQSPEKKEHPRQVRVDQELYDKAVKKAKSQGLNFSAYVRQLIAKDVA
jgi:predicted DNA binding CopG/RHH family protein